MLKHALLVIGLMTGLTAAPASAAQEKPAVKLSSSGICHTEQSPFYEQTKRFTGFQTLEACLEQGRLPQQKSLQLASQRKSTLPYKPRTSYDYGRVEYDRDAFGPWADADKDCINTRHELLAELSTGPIQMSKSGCTVVHGRWNDPYTGQIHTRARDLDVDHLVPLAYAWSRGADSWSSQQRIRFANDPANLYAVDARVNRNKGPRGPAEWIPTNPDFQCQYVLRFQRVSKQYGLRISNSERASIRAVQDQVCSN